METIELKLEEETLERARHVAASRGVSLEELVRELLSRVAESAPNGGPREGEDPLWGLFRDDAPLLDQIVAEAMKARARDPLDLSPCRFPLPP
jgi:hypothetical protein